MLFRTRYGQAVQQVLQRYGASEPAIVALEILVLTAQSDIKQKSSEDLAKTTCRGLHMDKPGKGVVCSKCFEAVYERHVVERVPTGDEIAQGRNLPPSGMLPTPAGNPTDTLRKIEPPQPEIDHAMLEAEVQQLLKETKE